MMEIYERVITVSEMMTSRQLVKYMLDVLFGNQSKRVFTDVKKTDERYMTLGRSTRFTNFLNADKTAGEMTKKIADGIYHRCRYNLFPEEYQKPEKETDEVTEEETREFANKFVCLLSVLFDINFSFYKIRNDDAEELVTQKKEDICTLLKAVLKVFEGKIDSDVEAVRRDLLEAFLLLRTDFCDEVHITFSADEVELFRSDMIKSGEYIAQLGHRDPEHFEDILIRESDKCLEQIETTFQIMTDLLKAETLEEFCKQHTFDWIMIPDGTTNWKECWFHEYARERIVAKMPMPICSYVNQTGDFETYKIRFSEYWDRVLHIQEEIPLTEQNQKLLGLSGWSQFSKMISYSYHYLIFQCRINAEFIADGIKN